MANPAAIEAGRRFGPQAVKLALAALALMGLLLVAVITSLFGGLAYQQQQCAGAGPDGAIPGGFVGPGSLGGVAGTGVTRAELATVRSVPQGRRRVTPGTYRSTAYGPPWGIDADSGVDQGAGQATAGGIRLNGGAPRLYMIAVDPALVSLGELVYAWPNPFGWKGPFVAADTGGAINGRDVDFYDWRGRRTQLAWSKPTRVGARPIRPGGPDLTAGLDGAGGLLPIAGSAPAPTADCDAAGAPLTGPAGRQIATLARRYLGKGPAIPGFEPPSVSYAWCAWFVTNVWRKAGIPIPLSAASNYPYQWAQSRGLLFKRVGEPPRGKTPPLGSALMYGSGPASTATSQHINLVSRVYGDGSFDLIGGNQGCPTGGANCVSRRGPCRLVGGADTRLSGPACGDSRPVYGIAMPTKGGAT